MLCDTLAEWKFEKTPDSVFKIFISTHNVNLMFLSKQSNRLWKRQALNTQKLIEMIEPFNYHWWIKICPKLNFKTSRNDSENANYGILILFWRYCIQLHWALDNIFSSNLLLLFHIKDCLPYRQCWFRFNELRHRRNHICTISVVGEPHTA